MHMLRSPFNNAVCAHACADITFCSSLACNLLLNLCQKVKLGRCNSLSDLVHLLVSGASLAAEDAAFAANHVIYSDIPVCLFECNARRPAAHADLSGCCGGHAVCVCLPSIKCLHALHTSLAVFAHLMSLCTFGRSGQVVACKHSQYTKPMHTATVKVR